ncbi:hypothetical protein HDU84_008026 [Entophlyctis sp. JEL0112]|nr:hypothetical protein HDU84_008026 [Entophlyctis sp. JEL0112]
MCVSLFCLGNSTVWALVPALSPKWRQHSRLSCRMMLGGATSFRLPHEPLCDILCDILRDRQAALQRAYCSFRENDDTENSQRSFLGNSMLGRLVAAILLAAAAVAQYCTVYTIQGGDTCDLIADAYNINPTTLLYTSYNSNLNCADLIPGDQICGGFPPPPAAPASGNCIYLNVTEGDTCLTIAARCPTPLYQEQLAVANPGLDCSTLQPFNRICCTLGTLKSWAPSELSNGNCAPYTVQPNDYCALIAAEFDITVAEIEAWNVNSFHWHGCANLDVNQTMCLSPGNPPPPIIDPNAECGIISPSGASCPLNVCCSPYGYCGLSAEFCNPDAAGDACLSNCGLPILETNSGTLMTRAVGYYALWSSQQTGSCFVSPYSIPLTDSSSRSIYSHINLAFAVIDSNFQLTWNNDADAQSALTMISYVRSYSPNTKILVSVGGWDFSEDTSTRALFSEVIATDASRMLFANSVIQFLNQNNLDGIDIDFEYPAAIERGGPPSDTANLLYLMADLRILIPEKVLSIAAPAGYWFLKGFSILDMSLFVNYINVMTYDYHGPWDITLGLNDTANPQTGYEDIVNTILLFEKAGVDPSKLNIGLGWYGRTYGIAGTCSGYGCQVTGGGIPGTCSQASGVLSNDEIQALISANNIVPTYDSGSETYYFIYENEIVTMDKSDTYTNKILLAQNAGWGGYQVWSIDQQTTVSFTQPKNSFNKQLAIADFNGQTCNGNVNNCVLPINRLSMYDNQDTSASGLLSEGTRFLGFEVCGPYPTVDNGPVIRGCHGQSGFGYAYSDTMDDIFRDIASWVNDNPNDFVVIWMSNINSANGVDVDQSMADMAFQYFYSTYLPNTVPGMTLTPGVTSFSQPYEFYLGHILKMKYNVMFVGSGGTWPKMKSLGFLHELSDIAINTYSYTANNYQDNWIDGMVASIDSKCASDATKPLFLQAQETTDLEATIFAQCNYNLQSYADPYYPLMYSLCTWPQCSSGNCPRVWATLKDYVHSSDGIFGLVSQGQNNLALNVNNQTLNVITNIVV